MGRIRKVPEEHKYPALRVRPIRSILVIKPRAIGDVLLSTVVTPNLRAAFPDAAIEITDLAGDGDHYAAKVTSAAFAGMPRVRQHQAVYAALGGRMGGELHALQLTTAIPD